MRLLTQLVSALAILHGALAVDQRKSVIVMFGKDAPNAVIEEAIKTLRDNGGTITHRYEIIKSVRCFAHPMHKRRDLMTDDAVEASRQTPQITR